MMEITTTDSQPRPRLRRPRNSVRSRFPRKKTIAAKRITKLQLAAGWLEMGGEPDPDLERPRTRDDCRDGARPCPYVSCKHHTYLDINPDTGSITLNWPDLEPHEINVSCSLDVADRGGATLEEVGEILNVTRERIRQIEMKALVVKLKPAAIAAELEGAQIDFEGMSPLAYAQEREIDVPPSEVTYQTI